MVKTLSIKKAVLGACVALSASLLIPSSGLAGTETATGKESKPVVTPEAPTTSWITGDIGDTIITEYISRGIILQNKGFIDQPYMDLFFKVYDGKGFINTVSFQLSLWSSIDSNTSQAKIAGPTGVFPKGPFAVVSKADLHKNLAEWYEFDWDPGITVTFLSNFTYTVQYFEFDSPSDSFNAARSINQTLSVNDAPYWPTALQAFALHPHFTALAELYQSKAGLAGTGSGPGWYFEAGVAPSYTFLPKSDYPPTVSLPMTIGWGTKQFYSNGPGNGTNWGYFSVGPTVSVPLAFVPKQMGSWTASASYLYYLIDKTVADLSPTGGGRESQHVFSGTIGVTF